MGGGGRGVVVYIYQSVGVGACREEVGVWVYECVGVGKFALVLV